LALELEDDAAFGSAGIFKGEKKNLKGLLQPRGCKCSGIQNQLAKEDEIGT